MKIAVLLVGALHDRGFNASALIGAGRMARERGFQVEIVAGLPYDPAAMVGALCGAARRNGGVIFIGGQGDGVAPAVAAAHPDTLFAVVQGSVTGPNLASYHVLQEHSAFLAGCLAGRMTGSGVVGHLSGHRVTPGLKGRAAFVAGVRHVAPTVRVLTGFCGTQDDNDVAQSWAEAEIAEGADIIFTMLNGARQGAIDACRTAGVRQIGNALDWPRLEPGLFLASALARIDLAVALAAADMRDGRLKPEVRRLGLAEDDAVGLSIAPDAPQAVADELVRIRDGVACGAIDVSTSFEGSEFTPRLVGRDNARLAAVRRRRETARIPRP